MNEDARHFYCEDCSRVKREIKAKIYAFIYRTNMREQYQDFAFKVNIEIVKIKEVIP